MQIAQTLRKAKGKNKDKKIEKIFKKLEKSY